jgi:hypothetical protein
VGHLGGAAIPLVQLGRLTAAWVVTQSRPAVKGERGAAPTPVMSLRLDVKGGGFAGTRRARTSDPQLVE